MFPSFDSQTLAKALSIACELLSAADHPAIRLDSLRERMASRIKLSADTAVDEDDLWMAALEEVQFEPRSAESPTAHLAAIWNEAA
jgi:two-component sensor histidine kinase